MLDETLVQRRITLLTTGEIKTQKSDGETDKKPHPQEWIARKQKREVGKHGG